MATPTFIFGADGLPKTPQEAARLRAIAQAMAPNRAPKDVGEGLTSLGNAIAYRMMMNKAAKGDEMGQNAANTAFSDMIGAGNDVAPTMTSNAPASPSTATTSPTPIPGSVNNARAADRNSVPGYAGLDMKSGIQQSANALGISPVDLATAISYETAGTMDPTKRGPTTQWGQHRGLIQFGEPQAQKYGVDFNNPISSQLGENGAVVKYLRDAGVRPGMGIMDIYSAINAGGVGRYGASDANNGGAPGTVADKVNSQMAGHRSKALAMFGEQVPGQTASADPQQAFSAVLGQQQGAPQASPAQNYADPMVNVVPPAPAPQPQKQPQQVAQAANPRKGIMDALMGAKRTEDLPTDYFPAAPSSSGAASPSRQQIMQVLANPYATPEQRAIAQDMYQQQQQASDPLRQMQIEKGRLELDAMRNPSPEYDMISGKDGSIFRADKRTGKIEQVYGGKPDLPTDVQEYEYAKQQGFQGTFVDFQLAQKRAGASSVNIDQKAEGAFDKKLAEKQAEAFDTMATDGMNARADVAVIDELSTLMAGRGGTFDGISGSLAKYGIGGEGVGDIQAAQALINRLVPSQRQPGSGSMSDRDVELFTRSLPSLWNQPGGNQRIINTMRGLAQYKQMQGDIAQRVMTGEIDRQTATKMLRDLPNPLEGFRQKDDGATKSQDQAAPAGAPSLDDLLKKYGD